MAGVALQDFALGIGRIAGRRPGVDAHGCGEGEAAGVAARAAVGQARAEVDIFVLQPVTVVVAVVADRFGVGPHLAVVFARAVHVEVVIVVCAAAAFAGGGRQAADLDDLAVEQLGVAVVVAAAAPLGLGQIEVLIDLSIAIVVDLIAQLDAAVGDHAAVGRAAVRHAVEADAAGAAGHAAAAAARACACAAGDGGLAVALVPAECLGGAAGSEEGTEGACERGAGAGD